MKNIRGMSVGAMGIALVVGGMGAQPAFAKVKASIDTTVRLGYDINPFLETGTDLGSGVARAEVKPALTYETSTGKVVLSGDYERSEYQRRYGHSNEYGANLDGQKRFSPKLDGFVSLRYESSIIGQSDDFVTNSPTTPPVDNTDVNLIGQRQRVNTYSAQAGLNYKIGPKDSISASGGTTISRYPSRVRGSDSNYYGGQLAYSHSISPRTKIGVSGSVYRIDYDTPGLNTLVMQPSVTFSTQFTPTWSFDASLGVSFSELESPGLVGKEHNTSWAGSADLCHKGRVNKFCLFASRSVSSSGIGGTTERDQIAVNFERNLSETLSANASASYAQTKSQLGTLGKRDYISVSAGLDKKLTRRFKVGIDGRYRDVFGDGPAVKADLGGEVSATLSLPGAS